MENDYLKYCITYLVDTGASKKYIISEISSNDFINREFNLGTISEKDISNVIEEMIKDEDLAFNKESDMLYVVEFMPKMAGKINKKEYNNVNKKWSYYIEKFEKKNE